MELRLQTEDSAAVRPPNLVSVAFVLEIEILELVHEYYKLCPDELDHARPVKI